MSTGTSNLLKSIFVFVLVFSLLWVFLFVILQNVYPKKFDEYVLRYSTEYNVDSKLVYSVMKAESNFVVSAVSSKDAVGLMQIMPATAGWIAGEIGVENYELSDPETNIKFSCWYLSYLTEKFPSVKTAVAAYNAGEGMVNKWLDDPLLSFDGKQLSLIPYEETEKYVKKVINTYNIYNCLY